MAVPRELFVPSEKSSLAYIDEDIALDRERYLMEPVSLARLLDVAEIKATDVVLEIGSATGYASALLSKLCLTVIGVESDVELMNKARLLLDKLGCDNVIFYESPLASGYPQKAPYDVIFINGGVELLSEEIQGQLREGGRLVYVDYSSGIGRAVLERKVEGRLIKLSQFDALVPVLKAFEKPQSFCL